MFLIRLGGIPASIYDTGAAPRGGCMNDDDDERITYDVGTLEEGEGEEEEAK